MCRFAAEAFVVVTSPVGAEPSIRQPFDPPYTRDDLPQLDTLHAAIGLGDEWLASEARANVAAASSGSETGKQQ